MMTAGMLTFCALVVVAIIVLIRGGHDDRSRWLRGPKHDDPLRVLDERLARSQIDLADYLGRCALLSKPRSLVTGHVWTSKEELEIAYNRYEVTWWEDSPTVQAMRADAEAYPGLLDRLMAARNAGLVTTQDVYVDDAGHYLPQRTALHEAIVSDCVPTRTTDDDPDRIPEAFFTIGPPGAGKTSTLRGLVHAYRDMGHGHAGMPLAIVDADQVRRALPEYASGLGSTVVGAECYDVTYDRVFPAALASRSDLVYDTLGGVDSVRLSIGRLIDAGYRVHVLRAEAPLGVRRARTLHRALTRDGRLVPEQLMKRTAEAAAETIRVLHRDKVTLAGWAEIDTAHPSGVPVALAADPIWAAAFPTLVAANS
jgi:hypothetical protein